MKKIFFQENPDHISLLPLKNKNMNSMHKSKTSTRCSVVLQNTARKNTLTSNHDYISMTMMGEVSLET